MATKAQKQEFISKMWQAIYANRDKLKGLLPSVILVQSGFESGWGQDGIAKQYNNYFGFKVGSGRVYSNRWDEANGKRSFNTRTNEYDKNGNKTTIKDNFRVYDSMEDSLIDRNALIQDQYKSALSATTPLAQLTALKNGGYSTSPTYDTELYNQIKHDGLEEYDKLLQQALAEDSKKKPAKTNKQNKTASTSQNNTKKGLKGWQIALIVAGGLAVVGTATYYGYKNITKSI